MGNDLEIESEKSKKKFRWGLFSTGACLFLIGVWFGASTIHYKASETIFPFRTAGWFILGFIFLAVFAAGYSLLFCLIANKRHKLAWALMLISSWLFIYKSFSSALPENRLAGIIGEKAAGSVKLEELNIGDSFNDGTFAYGIISGNEKTLALIEEYRPLEHRTSMPIHVSDLFRYFKTQELPETGNLYSDSHGSFYLCREKNKIYFSWHSRRYNTRK